MKLRCISIRHIILALLFMTSGEIEVHKRKKRNNERENKKTQKRP
jgi:hypothetical protein